MSDNRHNPVTAPGSSSAPPHKSADEPPRAPPKKRKGHRGGKKKRSRRKSFAILEGDGQDELDDDSSGQGFYQGPARNLSGTSLDSEALLDHR